MSDGTIKKIQLPDGSIYDIGGSADVDIDSTYNSSTKTVTLTVGSLNNADNTEY